MRIRRRKEKNKRGTTKEVLGGRSNTKTGRRRID